MLRLLDLVSIAVIKDAVAAGTTTQTSSTVDMAGCEGFIAIGLVGTAAADNSIKLQHSDDDSTYADVAGSSNLSGASGAKCLVTEVYKPSHRYYQVVALRGTSTTLDKILVIKYGSRLKSVVSAVTNVLKVVQLVSPAAGTP